MKQVTVSSRAFLARMKRHLAKDGLSLKAARYGTRTYQDLGPFYTVTDRNVVEHPRMEWKTLESWAREDGVIKPYEAIEDE